MQPDWEIWLDSNISPAIAKWMAEFTGYTVKSSYLLSLQRDSDFTIYKKAKEKGNVILVSKDSDFPEIINRLGSPPMLLNLKIGNCSNKVLWNTIKPSINQIIHLLQSGDFSIVDFEY
jgi:predicted nuclease of predicted toxin-antitoxin system